MVASTRIGVGPIARRRCHRPCAAQVGGKLAGLHPAIRGVREHMMVRRQQLRRHQRSRCPVAGQAAELVADVDAPHRVRREPAGLELVHGREVQPLAQVLAVAGRGRRRAWLPGDLPLPGFA